MKINVPGWDQILRLFFGTLLTAFAIAGGPSWAYAGLFLLVTGAWGVCPVRAVFSRSKSGSPS